MLKNKAVILAKIQVTKGTDPVPTAATNAIMCGEPSWEIIDSKVERPNIKSFYGSNSFVAIGEGQRMKFSTELKGSGTTPPSTAPEIGVLFRGCGFTQTITATPGQEKVVYDPNSSGTGAELVTLYYYLDGILHKMVDCRGTFSLEGKVNQYVTINWEFTGIYQGPVDSALVTGTFNATAPPLFRAAAFAIDGYSAVVDGISIDIKNDIVKRMDLNAATGIDQWYIQDRAVTGKIAPELVTIATKDFWGLWEDGTDVAYTATVGSTAGNRCTISASAVQIDKPAYESRDKIVTLGLPLVFKPTATGNDDIKFTFN